MLRDGQLKSQESGLRVGETQQVALSKKRRISQEQLRQFATAKAKAAAISTAPYASLDQNYTGNLGPYYPEVSLEDPYT